MKVDELLPQLWKAGVNLLAVYPATRGKTSGFRCDLTKRDRNDVSAVSAEASAWGLTEAEAITGALAVLPKAMSLTQRASEPTAGQTQQGAAG